MDKAKIKPKSILKQETTSEISDKPLGKKKAPEKFDGKTVTWDKTMNSIAEKITTEIVNNFRNEALDIKDRKITHNDIDLGWGNIISNAWSLYQISFSEFCLLLVSIAMFETNIREIFDQQTAKIKENNFIGSLADVEARQTELYKLIDGALENNNLSDDAKQELGSQQRVIRRGDAFILSAKNEENIREMIGKK